MTMTGGQIAFILLVVTVVLAGQILFKMSSQYLVVDKGLIGLLGSLMSWQFILAMLFYALGAILWVVVLKYVPLNRAYPFMAISFVILPLVGVFVFGEALSMRYMIGFVIFITGLYLVASA